jgi:hypothetical protein
VITPIFSVEEQAGQEINVKAEGKQSFFLLYYFLPS